MWTLKWMSVVHHVVVDSEARKQGSKENDGFKPLENWTIERVGRLASCPKFYLAHTNRFLSIGKYFPQKTSPLLHFICRKTLSLLTYRTPPGDRTHYNLTSRLPSSALSSLVFLFQVTVQCRPVFWFHHIIASQKPRAYVPLLLRETPIRKSVRPCYESTCKYFLRFSTLNSRRPGRRRLTRSLAVELPRLRAKPWFMLIWITKLGLIFSRH